MAKFSFKIKLLLIVLITITILVSCSRKVPDPKGEVILAKIGNKSITADEFIRRAEYTIRPPYCKSNYNVHKMIILNSLIAEKLMALEAGGDNELTRNEQFQDYIRGRQEQAMRQYLYHKLAYEKVDLDTSEIKKIYNLAGRTYKLDFISLKDSSVVNQIKEAVLLGSGSFAEISQKYLGINDIPKKEVDWKSQNEEAIQDALFSEPLKVGQLIGPIQTEDSRYLLMNVSGWIDRPAISDTDIQKRWENVKQKLTEQHAATIYKEYAAKVMKGKKVKFARETFLKLAEAIAPFYLKTKDEKEEAFNKKFWKDEVISESIGGSIDEIIDSPILRLNGDTWLVRELLKEIRIHPLVFRKRRMSKKDFPEQLKLAIVDLIRDKHITKEAYKMGYDKVESVKRNATMWEDHLLSMYHKNQYLKTINGEGKNYINVIEKYLNPHIDSLHTIYKDKIELDIDQFEKIELTNIDMFAWQKNVPFPVIVPGFPLLTTDHQLDYVKKMVSAQ